MTNHYKGVFTMKYLNLDTDSTFAANSDYVIASQKAIKTAIDSLWNALRYGLSLVWTTQEYTTTTSASSYVITLDNPAHSLDGLLVFINDKTKVPDECLSLSSDGSTLTITSSSVMPSGLLFTIKSAQIQISE